MTENWSDIEDDVLVRSCDSAQNEAASNQNFNKDHDDYTPPLYKLRKGILYVTDMTSQMWCEQQMVYSHTFPTIPIEVPEITEGANVHKLRELEIQDTVQVSVTSREDGFAIKLTNLIHAFNKFLSGGSIVREVPIFGIPFDSEIFISGIIDEIQCDQSNFEFSIYELKTRAHSKRNPSKAQKDTHKLQLMLYKKMFDDLIRGTISEDIINKFYKLDFSKELGDEVKKHCLFEDRACTTLRSLFNYLLQRAQCLTFINELHIEYVFQKDMGTIGFETILYDEEWMLGFLRNYALYWKGQREPCGIDIEEAWKCQKCTFVDVCSWRKLKNDTYQKKNFMSQSNKNVLKQ